MTTQGILYPTYCAHCGGAVTLEATPDVITSGTPINLPSDRETGWHCPLCHERNAGRFPTRIVMVSAGRRGGATRH